MRRKFIIHLLVLAAVGLALGGCHYGSYGFSYQSGYSFHDDYHHHHDHHHGYHGHHGHHHDYCY